MILFFVLSIFVLSIVVIISLFAPHKLPWYRPHLILNPPPSDFVKVRRRLKQPIIIEGLVDFETDQTMDISSKEKIARLENILIEKNVTIEKLQKQVLGEKLGQADFQKVKSLLDQEIVKLRKQNKELKANMGETR